MKTKSLLETGMLIENKNVLTENVNGMQKIFLVGIIQRANAKNKNGRIYPKDVLEQRVEDYVREFVMNKNSFGELDHPESSVVELKNTSHTIEELWWEGDDLYGKLELLNTPSGNIAKEIILAGKALGISSRALGSVESLTEDTDTVEVQEDLELICWDLVSNPSTHRAFLNRVNENKMLKEGALNLTTKTSNIDTIFNNIICNMSGKCELKF